MTLYCWLEPGQDGWTSTRRHLQAFIHILGRWPGCPAELRDLPPTTPTTCPAEEYRRLMDSAITFYVQAFVTKYQRLPIPPMTNDRIFNVADIRLNRARMGRSKWRLQEIQLLEDLDKSDKARQLYGSARQHQTKWWRNTVDYYINAYLKKFKNVCFVRETDSEFAARQARMPSANLVRFEEETVAQRQERLSTINRRIENYIKNHSPNKLSRTGTNSRTSVSSHPSQAPPIASTEKVAYTSGFQQFKKSDHIAKPPMQYKDGKTDMAAYNVASKEAYEDLPDREQFEERARQVNAQRSEIARRSVSCTSREEKAEAFPKWIGDICTQIGTEIGWIGWFPVGGVDEHGQIKAIFPSIGSSNGATFEDWLAHKIGWSVRRLRNEFDNYLQDVFDPPFRSAASGESSSARINQPAEVCTSSPTSESSTPPATPAVSAGAPEALEPPSLPEQRAEQTANPLAPSPSVLPSAEVPEAGREPVSSMPTPHHMAHSLLDPIEIESESEAACETASQADTHLDPAEQRTDAPSPSTQGLSDTQDDKGRAITESCTGAPAAHNPELNTPSSSPRSGSAPDFQSCDRIERAASDTSVPSEPHTLNPQGEISSILVPQSSTALVHSEEVGHSITQSGNPPRQLPKRTRTKTARAQNRSPDMNAAKFARRKESGESPQEGIAALPPTGTSASVNSRKRKVPGAAPGGKKRRRS
ncbi:hypothetical protein GY45DRAFT_1341568 [Cubamyces sp. BRFM 1775]|nr:hypothetical protein GY45DRAFT_1341568 [Cubamyces sp. BRFM 1775]